MLPIFARASGAKRDLALHRTVVQLRAIGYLNDAGGVTDRGKRLVSDLGGNRIRIVQIEAVKHLAAGISAIEHFHFEFEIEASACARGFGFGVGNMHVVPSGRDGVECGRRGDG
jgi:hypothetical protein